MNTSKISIRVFELAGCHHYSLAGDTQPDARSRGYLSRQEATKAGITAAMVRGLQIESVVGGDRKTARALGVKPLDSRGNARRGTGSKEHQRERFLAKIEAKKKAAEDGTNGTDKTDGPSPDAMSPAKRKALAKAQAAHREAIENARKSLVTPEGFRSMDHFLDSVAERCGRVYGGQGDLATYLATNRKSVSRWLKKEQYPVQATIDAMARWYVCGTPNEKRVLTR